LGKPNLSKLTEAIEQGIRQCIRLYVEPPPKGGRDSFGFAAYEKFEAMLTNKRNKQSWQRLLPVGSRMYAALAGVGYQPGAFGWSRTFPANHVQDRRMYAQFIEEAARILGKPALKDAGDCFQESSMAWTALSEALLPESVPMLSETRNLLLRKKQLFIEQGGDALQEIQQINAQLNDLRARAESEFPLSVEESAEMRAHIAGHVQKVAEIERKGVAILEDAMG
jgi:hypothetical protein